MKKSIRYSLIAAAAAFFLVLADQWTKQLAVTGLMGKDPFVLIPGVLELRYIENRGAAFSLMQNQQIFFYILTTVILCGILWLFLFRIPQGGKMLWLNLLCVTLTAGAVGNLIDRVRLHYVVDFIYFRLIDFPVFNVADIYVTCSCAALFLLLFFYYKEDDLKGILPG